MRRNSRDLAFKLIYEGLFIKDKPDLTLREIDLSEEELEYALNLYEKYYECRSVIEQKISAVLKGYLLERLYKIDNALLALSVCEIDYFNTPKKIVINEILELSKIYSDVKSPRFLNGLLSKIYGADNE